MLSLWDKFEVCSDHKSLGYLFLQKDLNLRQCRWVEYLQDYDFSLHFQLGKANIVADALRRKSCFIAACIVRDDWTMIVLIDDYDLYLYDDGNNVLLHSVSVKPMRQERIIHGKFQNPNLSNMLNHLQDGELIQGWTLASSSVLKFMGRIAVPNDFQFGNEILTKEHRSRYIFVRVARKCTGICEKISGGRA